MKFMTPIEMPRGAHYGNNYFIVYSNKIKIDVYEELGFYHEPYQLYGSCEKRKATQYTVFPILQDLFDDLTNQAYRMLKKRTIKLDTAYLSKLKANIWDVPQYAVLYYQNRTDIYIDVSQIDA